MVAMGEIVVDKTCKNCKKEFEVHVPVEAEFVGGMGHAPCPSCGNRLGSFPGKVPGISEKG
jgi:hypothetical protein